MHAWTSLCRTSTSRVLRSAGARIYRGGIGSPSESSVYLDLGTKPLLGEVRDRGSRLRRSTHSPLACETLAIGHRSTAYLLTVSMHPVFSSKLGLSEPTAPISPRICLVSTSIPSPPSSESPPALAWPASRTPSSPCAYPPATELCQAAETLSPWVAVWTPPQSTSERENRV